MAPVHPKTQAILQTLTQRPSKGVEFQQGSHEMFLSVFSSCLEPSSPVPNAKAAAKAQIEKNLENIRLR